MTTRVNINNIYLNFFDFIYYNFKEDELFLYWVNSFDIDSLGIDDLYILLELLERYGLTNIKIYDDINNKKNEKEREIKRNIDNEIIVSIKNKYNNIVIK